jgi:mRNA-degrading endonuclease YafQ of YafQ-DinJ toxin-antitoxin module
MRLENIADPFYIDEDALIQSAIFQKIINEDQQPQNLRGPFTATKLLEVLLLSAKKDKGSTEPAAKSEPTFMYTRSAEETIGKIGAREAEQVNRRLQDFINFKKNSPLAAFGKTDNLFKSDVHYRGFRHCHLTHDLILIYKYDGQKNQFCIFGVYSHDDIGIGTPRNNKRQFAMATRWANQAC